ncbi:MAG: tRNA (guanosine(37)-N1)-methyltransferase TrmD [Gammaproteobacteria bacterium]|nr:tRNA (guanosine(37)-N1)-methyltransferase TrmD [Gammaproteobacteria bacterium]
MRIDVITLFPQMFDVLAEDGVVGRAIKRGQLQLERWNPRDYTQDRHRTVDDRPYGGGPGMVMKVAPLRAAIHAAKAADAAPTTVVYASPQGRRLTQQALVELAQRPRLVMIAGRYEGIDERLIASEIDEEWSIGDYVLSGGELPLLVMIDGIARLLPGVLGHEESAQQDSFMTGLLDCPHYTRPEVLHGIAVPTVLLSGNHEDIRRWRLKQALGRTWLRRPDLIAGRELSREQQQLLDEFIAEMQEQA